MKRRLTRRSLIQNGLFASGGVAVSLACGARVFSQETTQPVATWISTTEKSPWQERKIASPGWRWDTLDVMLRRSETAQTVDGFGGCFNELGWTSLNALATEDRDAVLREMFAPGVGANFTI